MQREIEFRAWNEKQQRMFDWDELTEPAIDDPNLIGSILMGDYMSGDYNLMQYTGLKDKNGKEIYEGDILSMHNGQYNSQVVWHTPEFHAYHPGGSEALTTFLEEHEVIGNIYENPKLLK